MTTEQFDQIKHLLPKAKNTGRAPLDNYRTLNAIFWILRTGAPCRDLPLYYGNWNIRQWCEQYIFINILRELNSGKSVLIEIDSTYCKVHQHAAGARKIYCNQDIGVSKGGKKPRFLLSSTTKWNCFMSFLLVEKFLTVKLLSTY